MPITEKFNLMENPLVGHIVRQMVAHEQAELLLGQAEKLFGKVPARVRKQLSGLNLAELKAASLRLLDAQRVEDLFAK